jgi:uncharacterized protein (DUF2132 family)
MDTIEDNNNDNENPDGEFNPKTNDELNAENPSRVKRKQATEVQLNNPLHGVKLVQVVERLVDYYGWKGLGDRVNIRCFQYNPTLKSSVRFLRTTPWARDHVEDLYLEMFDEKEDAREKGED